MAITLKDLPQSFEYALLKDKAGKKERIKSYIDATITRFPNTKDRITQF
jgi:hypothetical protein